jgi:hypothetical protein
MARSPLLPTTELLVLSRRPGRFPGETRVALVTCRGERARGLWFSGRTATGERPWADLQEAHPGALGPVARALGPGAAIMVAYGDDETEHALRRKVPPAATPLGLALVGAGCRWLKDWYFAEGGREGHTKLQGELPLDDQGRLRGARLLAAELEGFLEAGQGDLEDRRRAHQALAVLGVRPLHRATGRRPARPTRPGAAAVLSPGRDPRQPPM